MTLDGRITDAMSVVGDRARRARAPRAPTAGGERADDDRRPPRPARLPRAGRRVAAIRSASSSTAAPSHPSAGQAVAAGARRSARPSSSTRSTQGARHGAAGSHLHTRPRAAVRGPPDGRDGMAARPPRRCRSRPCTCPPATSRPGRTTRLALDPCPGVVGPHHRRSASCQPPPRSTPCPPANSGSRAGTRGPGRTRPPGELRSRYFATDVGIREDEATGAAAVVIGERLGRPLTIRQGVGSELHVRPGPGGRHGRRRWSCRLCRGARVRSG